jgi:hypothetical protein
MLSTAAFLSQVDIEMLPYSVKMSRPKLCRVRAVRLSPHTIRLRSDLQKNSLGFAGRGFGF